MESHNSENKAKVCRESRREKQKITLLQLTETIGVMRLPHMLFAYTLLQGCNKNPAIFHSFKNQLPLPQ